jgi:dihydroxy-acid dehydratase
MDWDRLGADVPCLLGLQPAGEHLMEDFYYAGGLPAILRELLDGRLLDGKSLTVNGATIGENVMQADNWNTEVCRKLSSPFMTKAGIAVLHGNLAPGGAIIKPCAASPALLRHRGRAVVFETIEDFNRRIDDEELDIDETCVMVLKNCGPRGYPGMPEVGNMRLPKKILRKGIRDMIRISDARMSGTAYGTVILHVTPEAAIGGPLALVENGDFIFLDVEERRLALDVNEEILCSRRSRWCAPPSATRGYARMYVEHVLQADRGADLDFLVGGSGAEVERDAH